MEVVLKEKPIFKKMEEKFKVNIETPYLEERKKQLKEFRSMRKPLAKKEFIDHEMNYM